MIAEVGMDMAIGCYVDNRQRHSGTAKALVGVQKYSDCTINEKGVSGVSFGEEVEDAVNIGGVANITQANIDIDELFQLVHFHRKGRPIRQMVDKSVHLAEINGVVIKFFHKHLLVRWDKKTL
jgi:hypothetical protein